MCICSNIAPSICWNMFTLFFLPFLLKLTFILTLETVGYWAPFLCGEKAQNLRSPCPCPKFKLGDINFALQQWFVDVFLPSSFLFWKLCCFVIWLGVGTYLCYWLRLFCTLVDHSEAISLVWTTRGFYPWFEGFSTLKILVPLFVLLVIYYCCSLIIVPHRFLQVRGNYIRCILWYIGCCCFPDHIVMQKL